MSPREELFMEKQRLESFQFPPKIWWDPVPDWFRIINKEQWFKFAEMEIELRKKELDILEQRVKGLQEIMR
jgi:hypothetical protein